MKRGVGATDDMNLDEIIQNVAAATAHTTIEKMMGRIETMIDNKIDAKLKAYSDDQALKFKVLEDRMASFETRGPGVG